MRSRKGWNDMDLGRISFKGMNLSNLEFKKSNLSYSSFTDCRLSKSIFTLEEKSCVDWKLSTSYKSGCVSLSKGSKKVTCSSSDEYYLDYIVGDVEFSSVIHY
jgi:hypothetical protein